MPRVGLTSERLVQAGAALADEVGFEHVTASELARRFGVKVASLYSHLKNTHELKTRIALLALDELAERASDALAGRAGKDALIAFANSYRDYSREHQAGMPPRNFHSIQRLPPRVPASNMRR